jgi:hypothetical protein
MRHGAGAVDGGKVIKAAKPNTVKNWLAHHGADIEKGEAILFKAVGADFKSPRQADYTPGTETVAPDWDGGSQECGKGLHFSPAPAMALEFNADAKRFVACAVKLKDIAIHPDGEFPQKCKARACRNLYEVDIHGRKVGNK